MIIVKNKIPIKNNYFKKPIKIPTFGIMKLIISSLVLIIGIAISFSLQKKPLFDDDLLHQITINAVKANLTLEETFANITAELRFHYGPHITPNEEWQFNCAGGFKSMIKILHMSITEYVMFFGSSVETTGMTGRQFGDIHEFVISGELTKWDEGTVEVIKLGPMDKSVIKKLHGYILNLKPGTYFLEHFYGFLPPSLPFSKFFFKKF